MKSIALYSRSMHKVTYNYRYEVAHASALLQAEGQMDEEQIRGILGEHLFGEIQAIREYVSEIPRMNERLGRVETDLADVKATVHSHTIILREHSADIKELKADVKDVKQMVRGHHEDIVMLKAASHTH